MATHEERRIREILNKYGEEASTRTVWRIKQNNAPQIKTEVLQRIAPRAGIMWGNMSVLRAERDEAVIMVQATRTMDPHPDTGEIVTRTEWSIGEAHIGVNYQVSGKQAAYVWAMAEKRAKDRVILRLLDLDDVATGSSQSHEMIGDQIEPLVDRDGPDEAETPQRTEEAPPPAAPAVKPDQEVEDWQRPAVNTDPPKVKIKRLVKRAETSKDLDELFAKPNVKTAMQKMSAADRKEVTDFVEVHEGLLLAAKPDTPLKPGVVDSDPMHLSNLVTLPTRISRLIMPAESLDDVDYLVEEGLSETPFEDLPDQVKDKVREVIEIKKAAIRGR